MGERAMPLDWSLLHSFLAVLAAGSLSGAAKALGISQPSLGRHVRQLESQLGGELFERRGQRLVPTPFAEQLARAAAGMAQGAAEVARLLQQRQRVAARTVRISASRMVSVHLLPALLAELHGFDLELIAEDGLSNLMESEADLAVRLVRPTQQSLVARRVGTIQFGLYASRSYLRRHRAPERASELSSHVTVGFDRSEQMARTARRLGLALERSAFGFRSDDRMVHWAAVRAGIGIGVLPVYVALREPSLVRVLAEEKLGSTGVWLAARRDVLAREHVREVFDRLRHGLGAALA